MIRSLTRSRLAAGTALATIAMSGSAHAGALEQVVPATIRLLYEEGRYIELGATYIDPEQSGEGVTIPPNNAGAPSGFFGGDTGQIFDSDWSYSGAYKADFNDRFSYLLAFDQPFAGHTTYGAGSFPFPVYQGTSADMETWQVTAALSYDVTPNIKLYGGVRAQRFDATVDVSFPTYSLESDEEWGWGYLVGAAYERPEIALRVALTYYSDISYDLADRRDGHATGRGPHHREHDHGRRDAAVGPARLPDRRRSEDPRLRLCPLGRLVRVRRHPAAVRSGDRGRLRPVAADRELRGRHLDLQPRRRAPAHRQSRRLVLGHLRAGDRRHDADPRAL